MTFRILEQLRAFSTLCLLLLVGMTACDRHDSGASSTGNPGQVQTQTDSVAKSPQETPTGAAPADAVPDKVTAPTGPVFTITGRGFEAATLKNGEKALSNRAYVWERVPDAFAGWTYTRTAGAAAPAIAVKATREGTLFVATSAGLPASAWEGWEILSDCSFAYNDRTHTSVCIYRRKVAEGEEIKIPQGSWMGTIVLTPPENNAEALAAAVALPGVPAVKSYVERAEAPPASERTLQLTAQNPREGDGGSIAGSLLVRELQRQAVALTARDELGMRTRDTVLGDTFTGNEPGKRTLLIGTQFWRASATDLILALPDGTAATEWNAFAHLDIAGYIKKSPDKHIATIHQKLPAKPWIDYAQIVGDAEAATREQLPNALKNGGLLDGSKALPATWEAAGDVPADVVKALQTMDPIAQFAAIRALHEKMQASGQNPQVIEGLVQGYANLALMLRPLDAGDYKAYMARSLLYAERLVVHDKSSAQSLYVRAYARAMAGLAKPAMDDLDAASQKPGVEPWYAGVLSAWCHYDLAAMQGLAGKPGPAEELASMLTVAIAADGYSSDTAIQLGEACLRKQPGNLWVMQTLFMTEQLGMTGSMPNQMRAALPGLLVGQRKLLSLTPELQAEAAKIGPDPKDGASLAAFRRSLESWSKTGEEKGEPSLAALALILRDEQFMADYCEAYHLAYVLGDAPSSIAAFVQQSQPAWRDHPMAGLLESFAVDPGKPQNVRPLIDKIQAFDGGSFLIDQYQKRLAWEDFKGVWPKVLAAISHQDALPMDLTANSVLQSRVNKDEFIQALREVSPFAAFPMQSWMRAFPESKRNADQAMVERTISDVKGRFGNRPALLQLCAQWAADIHDYHLATELLEKLNHDSPSLETCNKLVRVYLSAGDMTKAKALVDSAAKLQSSGLTYAFLASEVAEGLTRRFRYSEALPYEQLAASSYSAWGLTGLASCEQGLGNMDKVSPILQAIVERYDSDQMRWYAWAKNIGRADLPAATRALEKFLAANPDVFYLRSERAVLDGRHQEAIAILKQNRDRITDTANYLNYIVVAREGGDDEGIDGVFNQALKEPDSKFKDALVAMKAIASKRNVPEALRDFEIKLGPPINSFLATPFYLGRYLAASGYKKEAIHFMGMSLMQNGATSEECMITRGLLKELGEDPDKLIKQMGVPVDTKSLLGTWIVHEGTATLQWTFNPDSTVTSSDDLHGQWWESDGRILVDWTPGRWAEIPWPPKAGSLVGEGSVGKLEMSRKSGVPAKMRSTGWWPALIAGPG